MGAGESHSQHFSACRYLAKISLKYLAKAQRRRDLILKPLRLCAFARYFCSSTYIFPAFSKQKILLLHGRCNFNGLPFKLSRIQTPPFR